MHARASPPCCVPGLAVPLAKRTGLIPGRRALAGRVRAVDGPSAVTDLPPAEITWQIVVGAVAGATPFVVAGVEFSKRIIEQKKCEVCGGSGLVMKKEYYVRCQGCVLEKVLQRLREHLVHHYHYIKDGQGCTCRGNSCKTK